MFLSESHQKKSWQLSTLLSSSKAAERRRLVGGSNVGARTEEKCNTCFLYWISLGHYGVKTWFWGKNECRDMTIGWSGHDKLSWGIRILEEWSQHDP